MASESAQLSNFSENSCVICLKGFDDNNKKVHVRSGLDNLIHFSNLHGDVNLGGYLCDIKSKTINCKVFVHQTCRRDYTLLGSIPTASDDCAPAKRIKLRSSSPAFNWKVDCFFCCKAAIIDSRHPTRDDIQSTVTLEFRDEILELCKQRKDEWALDVQGRLQQCFDFVHVEAVYHKTCHSRFVFGKETSSTKSIIPTTKFQSPKESCQITQPQRSLGRPEDPQMSHAFHELCEWLEAEAELYTLNELHDHMCGMCPGQEVYTTKRLKQKLLDRYREYIFFAEINGRENVVCFRDMASSIINDKWYNNRKDNLKEDTDRIIIAASNIIRAEMRSKEYSMDSYPTNDEIKDIELGKQFLPSSLKLFLENLIPSDLKQVTIGNCITHALRPRSVIPPILFGLGVDMDNVFGSKWLISQLFRLGFSVSYDEVTRYKQSVIQTDNFDGLLPDFFPGSFTQWVGDNIDHNIITIDGQGTFHGMGIIAASTPARPFVVQPAVTITRLSKSQISAESLVKNSGVPIVPYITPVKPGLTSTVYKEIRQLQFPYILPPAIHLDLVWHTGWLFRDVFRPRPNWSGFMQDVSTGDHPPKADIMLLPIIDLNPSDETCIYSTLQYIQRQAERLNIQTPCITFDQPLWIKALDIIKAKSLNIVCRLGGFHMMMSFLGSIGSLMAGSGLVEALETTYGPNAVTHIISGKAISRAIRGHFLVDAALTIKLMQVILPELKTTEPDISNLDADEEMHNSVDNASMTLADDSMEVTEVVDANMILAEGSQDLTTDAMEVAIETPEQQDAGMVDVQMLDDDNVKELRELYERLVKKEITVNDVSECQSLQDLQTSLEGYKDKLTEKSRTARLWLQYMHYIDILKLFMRAERTGDWNLHLVAVSQMINLFAATGHNNYAKSARLYLQMMLELPQDHPWLYQQFITNGYHTIRRSDRYWAGLWSDLVIEQTMMRTIKSRGGLTRGRGMTEAVRTSWICSMHKCAAVHEAMASLTGLEHITSEQHVELGKSRIKRDQTDLMKINDWLDMHEPFNINDTNLRCLSTGLTATYGDGINCDQAEEVGAKIHHAKMDNVKVPDVSLKRADQVKTLIQLRKGIPVGDKTVHLDTTILFSRLIVLAERSGNMTQYFEYELTPYPTSLFKDHCMKPPTKSSLADVITKDLQQPEAPEGCKYVLDGGALLHRVRWPTGKKVTVTYLGIINMYLKYVTTWYGQNTVIVFDGYGTGPSTKDHEHQRRSGKSAVAIRFEESMIVTTNQTEFLANDENKQRFIHMLTRCLKEQGHTIIQAANDADTQIVSAALNLASDNQRVSVITDDTDILVLLVYHFNPEHSDIYFRSEAKRGQKTGLKLWCIRDAQEQLGRDISSHLLFVHAWGGCDTTSALHGQGKLNILKKLQCSEEVRNISDVFSSYNANQEDVAEAGLKLLVMMYGGKSTLNRLRYNMYMKMAATGISKPRPEKLPPTERAAYFHCLRIHLQVVEWKSLKSVQIDPTKWGWKLEKHMLCPIQTDKDPGPQDILKVVRCNCKSSSRNPCGTGICTCRKNGLPCVAACGDCHGVGCKNAEELIIDNDDDDNINDII